MHNHNIDKKEAHKFAELAEEWWNLKGPFRILHQMNPLRLRLMEECFSFEGKKILDVGCGGGILSEGMAQKGAEVTGIDVGEEVLSVARAHNNVGCAERTVSYQLKTVEELAEEAPESFDAVTCLELLEHVPDPKAIVAGCSQLVKPGGHVFFSTVNRTLKAYVFAILGAEVMFRLLPRGTHAFARFVKPSELAEWVRESGLTVCAISGISFNPFTGTFGTSQNCSINYWMHAVRTR